MFKESWFFITRKQEYSLLFHSMTYAEPHYVQKTSGIAFFTYF